MFFNTIIGWFTGHRIYKAVFKVKPLEKNELFHPGRMVLIINM